MKSQFIVVALSKDYTNYEEASRNKVKLKAIKVSEISENKKLLINLDISIILPEIGEILVFILQILAALSFHLIT